MPELTVTHIAIIAGALIVGILVGWSARSSRAGGEKASINATWQEQLDAQRVEHGRLVDQNKSLMEQNSQYQASNKDAKMRASELSEALREAFERRDELQRQLKDIRSNLEKAVVERDQLLSDASERDAGASDIDRALAEKDMRIEKLEAELQNWQGRLPPLIDRYRQRDDEAKALEAEVADARDRIAALETMVGSEQTRVEPVDADALGDAIHASNEPLDDQVDADLLEEDLAEDDLLDADLAEDEQADAEHPENEVASFDDDRVAAADADGDTGPEDDPAERSGGNAVDQDAYDAPVRDDLKLIKGVGPAIEKTLNELGIRRFDQLAAMSEYDINRVANRLKGFRSRIYREDWIGQARELQDKKASGQ